MKRRYQIDKQRAAQQFREQAGASTENIRLVLPLRHVQKGLVSLALAAFTGVAPAKNVLEVGQLVGPKN